jgi:hypothetical protein
MTDMTSGQGPERTPHREAMKGRVGPAAAEPVQGDKAMVGEGAARRGSSEARDGAGEASAREAMRGRLAPASAERVPGDKAMVGEGAAARAGEPGRSGTGTGRGEGPGASAGEAPEAPEAYEGRAAGDRAVPGRPAGHEAPLLGRDEGDKFSLRMRHAVGGFVDGPRTAVEEADHVLEELAGRFTEAVTRRRRTLRASWQATDAGESATGDTEQLRLALRDYREFTERLLRL